jgi:hypothetical protein
MRLRPTRPVLLAALAAALACHDALAPDGARAPGEVRLASGLTLAVTAAPTVVAAGDSVDVRVAVRNPTDADIRVTSGCSTLAMLGVDRADGTDSRLAAGFGCLGVVRPFTLAPGQVVAYDHRFAARTFDGSPGVAGRYRARAYSQLADDQRTDARGHPLPNAEAEFEVR